MADSQLTLSAQERDCLVSLLNKELKGTRVEEHRTRTPTYREHVVEQEKLIEGLLKKLGQPAK
jgi:hypothetical protein